MSYLTSWRFIKNSVNEKIRFRFQVMKIAKTAENKTTRWSHFFSLLEH